MKKDYIIGREKEYRILEKCFNANKSQLVIVGGRRRVGKTYLINEAFENNFAFKITGARRKSLKEQLGNFSNELKNKTGKYTAFNTWSEAFFELRNYLDSFDANKRLVVFFDEMPWLDGRKSNFLGSFEHFWNDYGSAKRNLLFIVCGSSASWIEDKILKNKGGLFDRQSAVITLKPFKLKETEEYLESIDIHWEKTDIVRIYMILGGIPYYLNYLDSDLTLNENVDNLFFAENALLKNEFDQLYSTLFDSEIGYKEIVTALSKNRNGLTRKEISEITGQSYNGKLSKMLSSLSVSGFINVFSRYGDKKEECYALSDYFSLFYLKFVDNNYQKEYHFWSNSYNSQSRRVYEGLGFDLVCIDHIDKIKEALSIGGVLSSAYPWFKRGSSEENGAQIDLVIDRSDKVYSLCEIKFYDSEFSIDKEYYENIKNKINVFLNYTKTKRSIQFVLISACGLRKNSYSNIVNRSVTIDSLF